MFWADVARAGVDTLLPRARTSRASLSETSKQASKQTPKPVQTLHLGKNQKQQVTLRSYSTQNDRSLTDLHKSEHPHLTKYKGQWL